MLKGKGVSLFVTLAHKIYGKGVLQRGRGFIKIKKVISRRLAALLEGAGLAFDIQKCSKFQKSIMVVLKL